MRPFFPFKIFLAIAVLTMTQGAFARETCGAVINPEDQAACQFLAKAGLAQTSTDYDSLQSEQFLKPLLVIARTLAPAASADPKSLNETLNAVINQMKAQDTRSKLFALEGLFKLYESSKDPRIPTELMAQGRIVTKGFEDRLGDFVDGNLYLMRAQALGLSTPILDGLKIEKAERTQVLLNYLQQGKDGSWINPGATVEATDDNGQPLQMRVDSPYKVILEAAAAVGKIDFETDRNILLKAIDREMKQFMSKKFDFSQLQGNFGVHELRRQLRWYAINAHATNGLIVTDASMESPSPFYKTIESKIDPALVKNYGNMPANPEIPRKDVCRMARPLYLAYTKYIEDIRKIKDTGEDIEEWTIALAADSLLTENPTFFNENMDSGFSNSDARKAALDDVKLYVDYTNLPLEGKERTQESIDFSQKNPAVMELIGSMVAAAEVKAREMAKARQNTKFGYGELSEAQGIYNEIVTNDLLTDTKGEIKACITPVEQKQK